MKLAALAVVILARRYPTGKLTVLTAGQFRLESVCSSLLVKGPCGWAGGD